MQSQKQSPGYLCCDPVHTKCPHPVTFPGCSDVKAWHDALFSSPPHKPHSWKELLIPPLLSDGIPTLQKLKHGKVGSDLSPVPLSSRHLKHY